MHSLWLLFYLSVGINFALLLFTVITAGLHDIQSSKQLSRNRRAGLSNRSYRPHVTILVPAHNEAMVIERCLRSIAALKYPHLNVLVLNDGSTDDTSQIANDYLKTTTLQYEVIDLYPNVGKGAALNYALKQRKLSALVMVLDADCTIAPEGLNHMAQLFQDERVMAASANVRINRERTILGLFQQIEYIVGYYHKRHNAFTNSEFIVGGQGATYWRATLEQAGGFRSHMQTEDIDLSLRIAGLGNKRNRLVYSPETLIYTESVPNIASLYRQRYRWKFGALQAIFANRQLVLATSARYTKLLTWFRLPQTIFGEARLFVDILLLALFSVIAVAERSLAIFFGAWFSVTVYTTFVILADQHTQGLDKLRLVLANFVLYPAHIGMTILNFVAGVQTLRHFKQLTGRATMAGSWVPPDRIGKTTLA